LFLPVFFTASNDYSSTLRNNNLFTVWVGNSEWKRKLGIFCVDGKKTINSRGV
jgi:hypothetical protein